MNLTKKKITNICIDEKLPSAFDSKGHEVKCLDCWIKCSTNYPFLFKIVTAILLIFHGPWVEENFGEMKGVIDLKLGQMDITTFDAIKMVKYSLAKGNWL